MTYLIDGRSLQHGSALRGIGTYLRGLLSGFAQIGIADQIELVVARGQTIPSEVAEFGLRHPRGQLLQTKRRLQPLVDPLLMRLLLRRLRPRLYHGVEYAQPIRSRLPVVITVHDLIPFIFPKNYPWQRREHLLALHLLRRADALIADSRQTRDDLIRI